jgi:hypothetical protein
MLGLRRPSPNRDYDELLNAAKTARLPFDREAWLNLAFYLDEQYVEWAPDAGTLRAIQRKAGQEEVPRPVVNKIMHFVQQEKAMVLQAKPTLDVLPATPDIMDLSLAAVSKAYLTWLCEPTNMNLTKQVGTATLWALIAGTSYLKWVWNPVLNRPEVIPCSFFELYTDPYAKTWEKVRYVIHQQFLDREQVYEAWGKELPASAQSQTDAMRSSMLTSMGSAPALNGVVVNELWYKPSRRYPDGLYCVWAGTEQLVPPRPLPYEHKRLPFTQIGSIERPDSVHYMAPVKYLRSAQMALNKTVAQDLMIGEWHAAPKWFLPSNLELEQMPNSAPHQVLRATKDSDPMVEPKILQSNASSDGSRPKYLEDQMMHIVGLHEVSNAQVPGRVEAAKAIELLKESDADRQATLLDTISASLSEGGWQLLQLAKQYQKNDVLVDTYTREGLPEVKRFKAEKIKPAMRVVPMMGPGLARSRAARQDMLMNMWQNQIITDPRLMAELMEMPFPSFSEPDAMDLRLARNENLTLADAQAIEPNSWDNHTIHIREHNAYRKTAEYLGLGEPAKLRFEHHVQRHEALELAFLQRQASIMAMTAGPPQGPPGAAPAGPPTNTATSGPPADTTAT